MNGFDPCTALGGDQAKGLGLGGPSPGRAANGTKSCTWGHYDSEPIESFYVEGNSAMGIEAISAADKSFKVGRFDAVVGRSRLADFEKTCGIFVSVRPGQVLQISYGYKGSTQSMSHDLACQKAKPVAEMVIANLDRGGN